MKIARGTLLEKIRLHRAVYLRVRYAVRLQRVRAMGKLEDVTACVCAAEEKPD